MLWYERSRLFRGATALLRLSLAGLLAMAVYQPLQLQAGFKQAAFAAETQSAAPTGGPEVDLGRVAFVRGGDIWVKALPDGEERRLTQDGRNDTPRWSPSGDWLAFLKASDPPRQELWVVRSSGAEARRVASLDSALGQLVAWSPTADVLAYVSQGGLFTVRADGSELRELAAPGTGVQGLAWAPEGERLAYARIEIVQEGPPPERFAALVRIDADGGNVTELRNAGRPSAFGFIVAGWVPDGSHVLFWPIPQFSSSLLADGVPLMAVPADGGTPVEVTEVMLAKQDFLDGAPDGRRLALVAGGGRFTWEDKAIAVATSPFTGMPQRLTARDRAALFPAWSPDGEWIAYTSGPEAPGVAGGDEASRALAQRRIFLVRPDGSDERRLTGDPRFRDERPRWSAGGESILFARFEGEGEQAQAQVWLMHADGSDQRRVVDELSPGPGWFGEFGYVDWGRLFDWQQPASVTVPRARDGRTLFGESFETTSTFIAVWGDRAAERWVEEHNAELAGTGGGPDPPPT